MGNPLNLKINTNVNSYNNYSPTKNNNLINSNAFINTRSNSRFSPDNKGKIPRNHIDIGPGLCPNNLEHHVHIVLHNGTNTPLYYKCSKCRYQQIIEKRNIKN